MYEAILNKKSGFTKQDLSFIESGISSTKLAIKAIEETTEKGKKAYIEKGAVIKAPSPLLFPKEKLQQLLKDLEDKRDQILAELSPRSSKGSNGGALTHKRNNNIYKVHIGSRGGKYIVYNGKKVYI